MRVVVGRIGRPHGIRGEVTIETRTDEPDVRFREGAQLQVDAPIGTLVVERTHWHSGRLLITFAGVSDRTEAEALRGLLLHVERGVEEAPDDPEEFYDSALISMPVQFADGSAVGEVCDVIHLPSQDLLVVRLPDEREVLVPFVRAIVPVVDPVGRRIVIDPPPGLLDDAE